MKMPRTFLAGATAALLAAAVHVQAQGYPDRPIRLVVPFPPGTASDFLARTIGAGLTELYKVQVVVDNRPGAGGLVGTPIVLNAAPNGYTLGLFGPPYLTSPMLQKKAPYDALRDAAPVAELAGIPNVIGVTRELPVRTLKEFVSYARARPGQLNYASVGVGSIAHFSAELVNRAAGMKTVHVPFKLLGDAWAEIFAGRVQFFVLTGPTAVPMVRDNRVRALAVSTPERVRAVPEVPTLREAGLPEAEHVAWFGLFAPAGTPQPVIAKLAGDVARVASDPQVRQRFESQGAVPVESSSPAAFRKLLEAELARYQGIVRDAGMQAQ